MLDRTPIRTQLLALVLAVVLPAAGLVAYALVDRLHEARRGAGQQLLAVAQDTAGHIDAALQRRADLLARLADRPLVRALDAQRCDHVFGEVVSVQAEFIDVALRDRSGVVLCASRPIALPAAVARAQPWFTQALRDERFTVGGAFALPPAPTWVVMLAQPVRNAAGDIGGLLVLTVDLWALQQQALPALPPGAMVAAFDREMRFLMRTTDPPRWIGQPLPEAQRERLRLNGGAQFERTGVDGIARLHVGVVVPGSGWQVYAALPLDLVYAGYQTLLWRTLAIGAATLLGVGLLAWRIGARIARPIDALAASAAAVAGGHAAPAEVPAGALEVVAVAADLRRLADEREQARAQQARLTASHAQLANAARDMVLLVDPQDRIVEANAAAVAAYGYSADTLRAMTVSELRTPSARAQLEQDRQAASQPEGALYETMHQRQDGSTLPVEVSVRRIAVNGQMYYQSFIRDVSARKRDEALLAGQNAVLAQIAQSAPLAASLDALARLVELQVPGMLASVLVLDEDGVHLRHGAAPSLPAAYVAAIDGVAIGPQAGSCGTAAHRRAPVIVDDIATDPLWRDWRGLALAHDLRACWSTPIVDARGAVLGTFAMYFRHCRRPDADQWRLLELVTHTAAIALARARGEHILQAQLDELQRWQALMIGREERMRELKAQVNDLLARQGQPPHYADTDEP